MNPVIVTFGAGAWAMTGGASIPMKATRATAKINSLLITASLMRVSSNELMWTPNADSHNRSGLRTTRGLYGGTPRNVK